jgi:HTH-type transcriptional regulator, transcriptional repressor of NAD biosynthesis genes
MTGRYAHGLVIGKFYPPHLGHQHVIARAAQGCDEVTVLVMAARRETISLGDRVAWLREAFASQPTIAVSGVTCDAPVDYGDQAVWAAQVAVMRAALARDGRPPVSAVFSSEFYGRELADRLWADQVMVDPGRTAVPVSASQVRADLYGTWDMLIPPARVGLAARVVVLGAESTGTTTIAGLLAEHYRSRGGAFGRAPCVGEHGRDYTAIKWDAARERARAAGLPEPSLDEVTWDSGDFDTIGREQTRTENEAACSSAAPLIVCDTDAFATSVWERRYLGAASRDRQPWATSELPFHDLYLLTSHEGVQWQDDGLREGDQAIRAAMTGWFAAALTRAGHSWVLLTGSAEDRLRLAIRSVDLVLEDKASFGASITQASGAEAVRAD